MGDFEGRLSSGEDDDLATGCVLACGGSGSMIFVTPTLLC